MSKDLYESIESMINEYKKLTDVNEFLYPGISEENEGAIEGRAEVALMAIDDLTSILVEIASDDELISSVDKLRDSLSLF